MSVSLAAVYKPGELSSVLSSGQIVVVSHIEGNLAWVSPINYAEREYTLPVSSLCSLEDARKLRSVWFIFNCMDDPDMSIRIWDFLTHPNGGSESCNEFNPWPMFKDLTRSEAKELLLHFHQVIEYTEKEGNYL